jgi:glycine/D-amino acid oxidase-like deaminating enzyme
LNYGETVRTWSDQPGGVRVETDRDVYTAAKLVVTTGPWAPRWLAELGVALEVRRKPVFWFNEPDSEYTAAKGYPCFLFELSHGVFYGLPATSAWGLKAAEHSGGEVIVDPSRADRDMRPADRERVDQFLLAHLPLAAPQSIEHSVCLYTMTPDEHFLVDVFPEHPQVSFAAGLSGHGFKFAPVLGEILGDLATRGRTDLPAHFLRLREPLRRANAEGTFPRGGGRLD